MKNQKIYVIRYREGANEIGLPSPHNREYFNSDFSQECSFTSPPFKKADNIKFRNCSFGEGFFSEASDIEIRSCKFEKGAFWKARNLHIVNSTFADSALRDAQIAYLKNCTFNKLESATEPMSWARGIILDSCTFNGYGGIKSVDSISACHSKFDESMFVEVNGLTAIDCEFNNSCLNRVKNGRITNCIVANECLHGADNVIIDGYFKAGTGTFWDSGEVFVYSPSGEVKRLYKPEKGIIVLGSIDEIGKDSSDSYNYPNKHIYVTNGKAPPGVKKISDTTLKELRGRLEGHCGNIKHTLEMAVLDGLLP